MDSTTLLVGWGHAQPECFFCSSSLATSSGSALRWTQPLLQPFLPSPPPPTPIAWVSSPLQASFFPNRCWGDPDVAPNEMNKAPQPTGPPPAPSPGLPQVIREELAGMGVGETRFPPACVRNRFQHRDFPTPIPVRAKCSCQLPNGDRSPWLSPGAVMGRGYVDC